MIHREEKHIALNLCGLVDPFSSCYRQWRPVSQETGGHGRGGWDGGKGGGGHVFWED